MSSACFEKYEEKDREFRVPEGTVRIADLAFSGVDSLERLVIPESVGEIGNYAFMNCYALREVLLPQRIVSMGAGLFQNCWQLRSVRLPEGTTTLGSDMFENCHALTEIVMPSTLEQAALTCLSGCRSLRSIHIRPQQLMLLPPSARYTGALTFMEDDCSDDAEGAEIIDRYVRERQKSFLDLAINRRSPEAVRYMISRRLLDEEALREYIEKSVRSGRTEITAILLDSIKHASDGGNLNEDPFA